MPRYRVCSPNPRSALRDDLRRDALFAQDGDTFGQPTPVLRGLGPAEVQPVAAADAGHGGGQPVIAGIAVDEPQVGHHAVKVLRQLEPYPNKTTNEVVDLFDKGLLDEDQVRLKVNFTPYIKRFERENIDIVSFASGRPMREKVSTILQTLQSYVSEEKQRGAREPQA